MTILDRANAFIGHEEEVDEGYETTMRRNAFIAGFKEALGLVKGMREVQQDFTILDGRLTYKVNSGVKVEEKDYQEHADAMYKVITLESEVDELLKEMKI